MGRQWPPRGPDDLDEEARRRMRHDVLRHLRPHAPTFGDHAYAVLSVLAAPAPYIVRAALALVVVASLVATATVASADALPEEPLYGVKIASEKVRLALARSPEDRAAVWLSMAEHRLNEAERLALAGREPEALAATGAYGSQLAQAAAELAAIERLEENGPTVVARLKQRLAEQQLRASDIALHLRTGGAIARSAPAFDTIASAPPADASGTLSERIAEHAAAVTDQVAAVAEQRAEEEAVPPVVVGEPPVQPAPAAPAEVRPQLPARAGADPVRDETRAGVGNVTVPDPTSTETPRPTETPVESAAPQAASEDDEARDRPASVGQQLSEIQKRFKAAIEQLKQKQKEAREAVKKAKERGKKTPKPARSNSRGVEEDRGGDDHEEDRGRGEDSEEEEDEDDDD